jgi:hypothetical protein
MSVGVQHEGPERALCGSRGETEPGGGRAFVPLDREDSEYETNLSFQLALGQGIGIFFRTR